MTIDNDTRGWIMTALSGVACMFGSLFICVDLIVRLIPLSSCKSFKIQDSNTFLSSSLSLSFGVMLFSALRNLLQNAESSLGKTDYSPKAAAWILLGCFFAGAAGIQFLARVAHHYMPHQVVDCDHDHEDEDVESDPADRNQYVNGANGLADASDRDQAHSHTDHVSRHVTRADASSQPQMAGYSRHRTWRGAQRNDTAPVSAQTQQMRPPLHTHLSQKIASFITTPTPEGCYDEHGQCRGFTDPCGKQCFREITGSRNNSYRSSRQSTLRRAMSTPGRRVPSYTVPKTINLGDIEETTPLLSSRAPHGHGSNGSDATKFSSDRTQSATPSVSSSHIHHSHHHHVPENAFMSIGLQTTIAIALHKLPEGFITFATNHANPQLGFTVFLALFIHNITEGFTMALPLFLALRSRWKAILWSTALGGLSQPLGAGIAALWFHVAGNSNSEPGDGIYGCMYAVIAGIMASVALQLFSESLELTHSRGLCLIFAFVGMGILGATGAMTA